QYTERLNFTEPMFVFVIMAISSTRPVINFAKSLILAVAKLIPLKIQTSFYIAALVLGPILGSFITEPAAMTVTAFLLKDTFFDQNVSVKAKYVTIAALFVNISIGGTLTHFAAPPVLMVASTWNW